jgi:hypothetical protein
VVNSTATTGHDKVVALRILLVQEIGVRALPVGQRLGVAGVVAATDGRNGRPVRVRRPVRAGVNSGSAGCHRL